MGVFRLYCKSETGTSETANAPNPAIYSIKKIEQVGKNVVLLVNFPNCTNFEGNKICVYKNVFVSDFANSYSLDPHFSDEIVVSMMPSPFARFIPTAEGWEAAMKLAEIL